MLPTNSVRLKMATKRKATGEPRGKSRIRAEIIEATRGLHKIGVVSDAELEKTTLAMLGREALPKVFDRFETP